ncbi:HAD family hydrolase [Tumebacillus permanentifrigoris]|uniref:HAD superfamily hydrolase (TIGR01509 family) n=1 Tax=Tumebacillus permanentifrigoris TaxID=378543 RepID=A0A316D4Z5_9BACL|nr:HAD hydrolase-like protein [Tumebacillus permanentifrigoris]PWK05637.1 HAD superfamily hydrolase (TIGR01509 family) [Tumebacillus permanentifrigoris]
MTPEPYEAMIFDVDGTLFQTEKVALPAFRRTFEELKRKSPSDDEILNVFGMTIPEVWETLLPDSSMDERDRANELLAHAEMELMQTGTGALYPGVQKTLQTLRDAGVKLFTASNGELRYVETVIETQGLLPLFDKLYCAGAYKTEKKQDLVQLLLREQHLDPDNTAMIGDRRSDITAGLANGLFTIGCDFGFAKPHELDQADQVITSFDQLLKVKHSQIARK